MNRAAVARRLIPALGCVALLGCIALLGFTTLLGCTTLLGGPRFVDVSKLDASIEIDMRYAGENNFVGTPVDGYIAARCLLSEPAAQALALVQQDLANLGLGLRVFDCYRPQRAVDHFARWARDLDDERTKARFYPSVEKSLLFESGYIAAKSGHSRGSTVDLTLVKLQPDPDRQPTPGPTGTALDMGTAFDFFDAASHTESRAVSPAQRDNRLRLRDAMAARGFQNFPKEWWHYTLQWEPYMNDYWDVPVD